MMHRSKEMDGHLLSSLGICKQLLFASHFSTNKPKAQLFLRCGFGFLKSIFLEFGI